ncbi:hypothetical protein [Pontiella sp.]|uniref:hypothetical protein n=1 Tax=Pontiella sp. TaxID=2837462 RepID=UPI003565F2AC
MKIYWRGGIPTTSVRTACFPGLFTGAGTGTVPLHPHFIHGPGQADRLHGLMRIYWSNCVVESRIAVAAFSGSPALVQGPQDAGGTALRTAGILPARRSGVFFPSDLSAI